MVVRAQVGLPHGERLRDLRGLVRQREEGGLGQLAVRLQQLDAPVDVARQVQRQEGHVQLVLLARPHRQRRQRRAVADAGVQQQRERKVARALGAGQRQRHVALCDAQVGQSSPSLRVVRLCAVRGAQLAAQQRHALLDVRWG